jgi:hypothetical protein
LALSAQGPGQVGLSILRAAVVTDPTGVGCTGTRDPISSEDLTTLD